MCVVRLVAIKAVLLILYGLPLLAYAEGEDVEAMGPKAIYLPIKPSFIVNYGGEGRLKYIKADLTVRLENSTAAASVRHHLPYVRNNLVRLFSSQTDETLESQEGKELLRQDALKEIQKIIMDEDKVEGVQDVLFNSLIIQK